MPVDRVDYSGEGLSEAELLPTPWQQARLWVEQAVERARRRGDVPEPLSISVATVDADGAPDVRTVLMRFFDERGPGFVTCLTSAKGQQLDGNPAVAAALTWPAMFRAIRFRGVAEELLPRGGHRVLRRAAMGVAHQRVDLAPVRAGRGTGEPGGGIRRVRRPLAGDR